MVLKIYKWLYQAKKKALSRALCDYLLYVEHNPRKALELATESVALGKWFKMINWFR